jgi:hypothetical protein
MFSTRTNVELVHILDNFTHGEIDRLCSVFEIPNHPIEGLSVIKKANKILDYLKISNRPGPYSDNFQMDLLQYIVDDYYRLEAKSDASKYHNIHYEDLFSHRYKLLANSLKRDGYIIKETVIKKMLPTEIEEAKTENELITLLKKNAFVTSLGHIEQAINNYNSGQWASANSQFRSFIESLLMDICKKMFPEIPCIDASNAIKILGTESNPTFLRNELNEIGNPFIISLWKRLHPAGSHPGLSEEADCTFRYHMSVVLAHYLLKRFDERTVSIR